MRRASLNDQITMTFDGLQDQVYMPSRWLLQAKMSMAVSSQRNIEIDVEVARGESDVNE